MASSKTSEPRIRTQKRWKKNLLESIPCCTGAEPERSKDIYPVCLPPIALVPVLNLTPALSALGDTLASIAIRIFQQSKEPVRKSIHDFPLQDEVNSSHQQHATPASDGSTSKPPTSSPSTKSPPEAPSDTRISAPNTDTPKVLSLLCPVFCPNPNQPRQQHAAPAPDGNANKLPTSLPHEPLSDTRTNAPKADTPKVLSLV